MPLFRLCPNCACSCGLVFRKSHSLTINSKHGAGTLRATQTEQQSSEHRSVDRARKARKRALETKEESSKRRSIDRACKAQKRALETEEQFTQRQTCNTAC